MTASELARVSTFRDKEGWGKEMQAESRIKINLRGKEERGGVERRVEIRWWKIRFKAETGQR